MIISKTLCGYSWITKWKTGSRLVSPKEHGDIIGTRITIAI